MLKINMLIEDRYRIVKVLGRGGTSCVYLAQNVRLGNYWAIKEVYKDRAITINDSSDVLIAESRILTKLSHPGLPTIIDIIDTYDAILIIMEYIEGTSIDKFLERNGAQSEETVIRWIMELCEVLDYLHSQQPAIIYRDMKPANIMLKPDGHIVLIDFGMAREFKYQNDFDTNHLDTHGYAAPEQYGNKQQTDVRTDIYGLGMTMYHMISGQNPCVPPYGIQPIGRYNPNVSANLEQVIYRCTQLAPDDRYQSVLELKRDLSHQFVLATDKGKSQEKVRRTLAAIGIILAIGMLIFVCFVYGNNKSDKTSTTIKNGYSDSKDGKSEDKGVTSEMSDKDREIVVEEIEEEKSKQEENISIEVSEPTAGNTTVPGSIAEPGAGVADEESIYMDGDRKNSKDNENSPDNDTTEQWGPYF